MKQLLISITILTLFGCEKVAPDTWRWKTKDRNVIETITQPILPTNNTTQQKVGFIIDTNWFKNRFTGYWIETHNWNGGGDFNNDGRKDLVVMFATNAPANMNHQKDTSSRIVIGVFINYKTYFELDTNLVYSYLGGFGGVSVADINHDGYLDIYQMTGYWEGSTYPKPSYYNNSGHGGMDSYLFLNNKNKQFIKYTIPIGNESGSHTSMIYDNNKNGFDEIYVSNNIYYEFDGNKVNKFNLLLNSSSNMRVVTPKYVGKYGVYYSATQGMDASDYFIMKVENGTLLQKIKYKVAYPMSGPAQEIYVEDLNKDGSLEYIIPIEIRSNSDNTKPAIPYLMIVDETGTDVGLEYMDEEITKPLTYEQINWVGGNWQTGFIYHTFADIDNDGIKEIFPASGIGYKKDNDTYYYKFINGKYRLQLYHIGWFGNIHNKQNYINYIPFVDEKNRVNVFLPTEKNLYNAIFKTF
jgi:hypothetical protein